MDPIHKLTEHFRQFPGIGPRQAKRFVYFLLRKNESYRKELSLLIEQVKNSIKTCSSCFRFFPATESKSVVCAICTNPHRDNSKLMVVAQDVDLENMEKSHAYEGYYFVLGGTVPILEKEPEKKIRIRELFKKIEQSPELKEIILAMNLTADGENTEDYLKSSLSELASKKAIKISILGRGLSTGTELEYSDSETLKNALKNRN